MSVTGLKMLERVVLFGDVCAHAFWYTRSRVSDTFPDHCEFLLTAALPANLGREVILC